MTDVRVPAPRFVRWVENFATRHGETRLSVADGALHGIAADRSDFVARLPFELPWDGPAEPEAFADAAAPPSVWGVLLVRKGGFAVASLAGPALVEHKVGRRHVQGRSKAGGQSQQRFARRRDNQARAAYDAAADHAARILRPGPLVVGGDRDALEVVLRDPRLSRMRPVGERLAIPDPRWGVLDQAVADASSILVSVTNR